MNDIEATINQLESLAASMKKSASDLYAIAEDLDCPFDSEAVESHADELLGASRMLRTWVLGMRDHLK